MYCLALHLAAGGFGTLGSVPLAGRRGCHGGGGRLKSRDRPIFRFKQALNQVLSLNGSFQGQRLVRRLSSLPHSCMDKRANELSLLVSDAYYSDWLAISIPPRPSRHSQNPPRVCKLSGKHTEHSNSDEILTNERLIRRYHRQIQELKEQVKAIEETQLTKAVEEKNIQIDQLKSEVSSLQKKLLVSTLP
ncbi:hypothetical protein MRX96_007243 [Rhipicephalus microplus]